MSTLVAQSHPTPLIIAPLDVRYVEIRSTDRHDKTRIFAKVRRHTKGHWVTQDAFALGIQDSGVANRCKGHARWAYMGGAIYGAHTDLPGHDYMRVVATYTELPPCARERGSFIIEE